MLKALRKAHQASLETSAYIEDIVAVILNGKLNMAALAEAVGIAESAGEIADEALILKGLQLVAA